jgi:hypothetical protein
VLISWTKKERMMTGSTVIPRDDTGKFSFIQHLNATLPPYAATLDFTADDLAQLDRATQWFKFPLELQAALKAAGEAAVAFKNAILDGSKGIPSVPQIPTITPPAGEPFEDAFGFASKLITRAKIHNNYTETIGKALGIIPAQSPGVDLNAQQPVLDVEFQTGHPRILWKMQGMDALEIEVDRGDGHFTLFTIDTTPNHLDATPLPALGSVVLWRYRAIFRLRDERVGQWSQVLEVSVKGV